VEDFTGFLLDNQEAGQSIHPQRGDAVEKDYTAFTGGLRGGYRWHTTLFGRDQAVEVGTYARYDHATPEILRLRYGTQIPYLVDSDYVTDTMNIAAFVDLDLKPLSWLTLRGGVRQEYFGYDTADECNTLGEFEKGHDTDVSCPDYDRGGPRLASRRVTATGQIIEPKATVLANLSHGFTLAASAGTGAQSLDATSISQDENAPFASLNAAEGGLQYQKRLGTFAVSGRALGYYTHVDRDLVFDPNLGRVSASTGTTREGLVGALRATGHWLDESLSYTSANATYDEDGTLVPYVPLAVARSDTAVFGAIGKGLVLGELPRVEAGLGVSWVGRRALPYSQFASPTLQLDASSAVRLGRFKLGLSVTNLTNTPFPLSEFFYASDFNTSGYATLTPEMQFTAAPPREFLATFEIDLQREKP